MDFATGPTYFIEYSRSLNVAFDEPIVFANTSATLPESPIARPNCPKVEVMTPVVYDRSFCVADAMLRIGSRSDLTIFATS